MDAEHPNFTTPQQSPPPKPHSRPRLACAAIGGVPLVHPPGHPQAGEVIEFNVRVPGHYEMTLSIEDMPSCFARFHVDIDEDGRARLRLIEKSFPDGYDFTALERELLDGLARIIVRDVLRQRGDG